MRSRLKRVLRLFAFLLLIYALLRLGFLLTYFRNESWSFKQVVKIFYWGMRLDFTSLFYINIPFLVYYLFIDTFIQKEWSRRVAILFFCIINIPFIALNFVDLAYFNFNNRRSTVDVLHVFKDSTSAFGEFFKAYGWLLLVFIIAAIVLVRKTNRTLKTACDKKIKATDIILPLLLLIMAVGVARGFQSRPIVPTTPVLYFESRFQPLVNNSTFNFLYSAFRKQTSLERKNYFSEQQLDSLFSIRQQYHHDSAFKKKNVVIFVLESFSKEYFKGYQQEAYMPFFDSLMQYSTVCNNAFANALESNKGLPAILASLPEVTDEPIYLSNYSNIQFKGIGHILKEQGYSTSFFMGAEYDHFGFAKLCKMVGIDEYHSMNTYGKRKDQYDGTWGIYDEYFFPYFAEVISKKQQPFFSVLFNTLTFATPIRKLGFDYVSTNQDQITIIRSQSGR
jgi:phosphoglycerol transferase MdoB-like AlkP superfamily enzyme